MDATDEEKGERLENPPEMKGVYDLSMLVYLEMHNVLYNLKARYNEMARKHPYTSISTILVAINPYERLPIYGDDVVEEFHEKQREFRSVKGKPHPYAVASRAFQRMVNRGKPQSTIVCGESGAGKSETAKLIMKYLAITSTDEDHQTGVEQQIIAASPILEAFGNAKTIWNNNSSRFGKFTKLLYEREDNTKATILGSTLETYLLEKSRVVFQASKERNYHVFYFVAAGLPDERRKELGLEDLMDFHYTSQGKCIQVPGITDSGRFDELRNSLRVMRVTDEDQTELWNLIAGILHLGNVEFKKDDQDFGVVNTAKCDIHVELCAKFWNIKKADLVKRLQTRTMKVMRKQIAKQINRKESEHNRDAIAKGIFENAFLWLCNRVNNELKHADIDDVLQMTFIGVLDVFGFENFKENSLEQFCINFTNEKLQSYFNENIIKSEQEEYIRESVFWTPIDVPDNEDLIVLIESSTKGPLKKPGFYEVLDSQCRNAQPDTEAFYQEMVSVWKKNKSMKTARPPKKKKAKKGKKKGKDEKWFGLILHHYAEPVTYTLTHFISKNMDAIHSDTQKMFKKSTSALIKQIGGQKFRKGRGFTSVTSVFHKGITTLMKNLRETEPYFVRCVNPNRVKSASEWDEPHVEKQLRCGGLIQALKVLKLGYPTRVPYDTLYDRYHSVIDNKLIKNLDPPGFAEAILVAWEVTRKDFELGLTKIFFKPAKASILDTIMDQAGKPLTEEQNQRITNWVMGKRQKQVYGTLKILSKVIVAIRKRKARNNWNKWGRMASIVGVTVVHNLKVARARIENRNRGNAALTIQNFHRGLRQTLDTRERLARVKNSVRIIYEAHRKQEMKLDFFKWLTERVEESRAERKRLEEERRKAEIAKIKEEAARKAAEDKLEAEKQAAEAALAAKRREEARLQEEARLAAEAEATRQREAQKLKEEEERKAAEAKAAEELERNQELARQQEEANQKKKDKVDAQTKKERAKKRKKDKQRSRNQANEKHRVLRDQEREEHEIKHYARIMPEDTVDDADRHDYIGDNYEPTDSEPDSDEAPTTDFKRLLATGQLFLKHTGKKRRKPQDRFVKVLFEDGKPKNISWGSGSRHINFKDITVIAWGHFTPVFLERKASYDETLCFSVVGKDQILDLSATDREVVSTWVRGLRQLKGMTPEESDELAEKMKRENSMPGHRPRRRRRQSKDQSGRGANGAPGGSARQRKKRTKSLMLLQQDLFVMTCTTVFRNLEEEGLFDHTADFQRIRDRFNAKQLYEKALHDDIPWRQWSHWVRQKIIEHLQASDVSSRPPDAEDGAGGDGAPAKPGEADGDCLIS